MLDVVFFGVCILYAIALTIVLFVCRREPLYDPRIVFTLAASLWLLIVHGYLVSFDGYLAAKPGFYLTDIRVLSIMAISMMLIGYLAFITGASIGMRVKLASATYEFRDYTLLTLIAALLITIAIVNFSINVVLISDGNLLKYLTSFATRPYDVSDDRGVSAAGYLLGFIGVQLLAFVVARRGAARIMKFALLAAVIAVFTIRISQARIFQTLVLLGSVYVSYAMGTAARCGTHVSWVKHIHYVVIAAAAGIVIYFLRLASGLSQLGIDVSWETVSGFSSRLVHFALERGNVPNFPVVLTIIDRMPANVDFLYGGTLFNWALYFIPKSILAADYLISLWVKRTWYLDIDGGGLPPTAVGEWYANFGISGVIVGMFVIGLMLGVIYRFARFSQSPYLAVVWANIAVGFITIYPKTDLAQIPIYSLVFLLCVWLSMKLLKSGVLRTPTVA